MIGTTFARWKAPSIFGRHNLSRNIQHLYNHYYTSIANSHNDTFCLENFEHGRFFSTQPNKSHLIRLSSNHIHEINNDAKIINSVFLQSHNNIPKTTTYIHHPVTVCSQRRTHATTSRSNKRNSKSKPLMNAQLVQLLVSQRQKQPQQNSNDDSSTSTSESSSLEVRVVTDLGRNEPAEVSILSLEAAWKHAQSLNYDLMEIDLKQNPPVLRAADYSKLMYDMKKKAQLNGGSNKQLARKEYKFKAGISEHDMERKIQNLESYLRKGHSCKVTITAKKFLVNQNNNIAMETFERVKERVEEYISELGPIKQTNPKHLSVLFQPKKQKDS